MSTNPTTDAGHTEPDATKAILTFEGVITSQSESVQFHFDCSFAGSFPAGRDALRRAIASMQLEFDRQYRCPFYVPEKTTTDAGNIAGTPLTDAKARTREVRDINSFYTLEEVPADFARDLERQLTKSREATAQAERERDEALARIKCPTCRRSIAVCKCVSLGSFAFDVNTG